MNRFAAYRAKITRSVVQAGAEMPLPDPIYRYAREQWVLRGGQPVRKCLPASVAKFGLRRRERESGWHGLAELRTRGIAGREHVVGFSGPLGIFFHGPKHRQRFGWLQFIDLFQVVLILL